MTDHVEYRFYRSAGCLEYGILANCRENGWFANVPPFTRDFQQMRRIIDRLNGENVPAEKFCDLMNSGELEKW